MSASTNDRAQTIPGAGLVPGSERVFWYFLRISGLLLVVLALGHLFITHYLNVPSQTVFEFVADRWANPLWRTFDLLLLFAAVWHGIIGLRMIATDLFIGKRSRQVAHLVLWVLGIIFTVMGTVTIFTFDVEAARNNTGPLAHHLWIGSVIGYSLYLFAALIYVAVILLVVWGFRALQEAREGRAKVYAGDTGQWAYILHRATGAGIVFFLMVHIIDIMLIGLGRDVYDHTVAFYGNWFIIPMEVMLVGAVIYHTLNGLRIIAINFSSEGAVKEAKAFWWVLAGTIILTIPSGIVILLHEL